MARRDLSKRYGVRPRTANKYVNLDEKQGQPQQTPGSDAQSGESEPIYSEETAQDRLQERMAGERTPHKETRAERSARNKQEWAERNLNKEKQTLKEEVISKSKSILSKTGNALQNIAGEFVEGGKDVYGEMYGTGGKGRSSKMPSQSETPVLKGTTSGSKYRVDDNGFLYVKDNSGKWINTGKKSKYKIPETVVDESTGLEVSPTEPEGGEPEMNGRRRTPRGMRGGGLGGMPPSGGSGGSGDVSGQGLGSLAGASRKRFGVGLGRMSAGVDYGMYNEEEEKARLAKIGRVKAPYMAGMSYLSAGGAGGGYSEEKAQKRLEEINRVKIPYAAGMNYMSAGTYTGNRPISSLGDSGKNVDAFSSGMYKVSYGGKKAVQPQQPVSLDQQIEQLQRVKSRQEKVRQIQQLQEETGTTPQPTVIQEQASQSPLGLEYPAPRQEMGALETLFGMRTSAPSTSAIYGGSTPTLRESVTPKRSVSATEDFFGLRSGNGSQLNSPESADVNRSATANFFGLNKPKRYPATQLQMQTRPVNPQNQQSPMPLQPLVKLKKLPKSVKQKLKQIQNMPPQQQVPMPSELPPSPQFQPPKKPRSEMTAAELLFGNR